MSREKKHQPLVFDPSALALVYDKRVRLPVYSCGRKVMDGIYGRAPSGRPSLKAKA